jgi:hypothetical protein
LHLFRANGSGSKAIGNPRDGSIVRRISPPAIEAAIKSGVTNLIEIPIAAT